MSATSNSPIKPPFNAPTEHEIEEAFERFAQHREPPAARASTRLSIVGSLLVLLVLAIASSNAHAQLPNPGMEIDPVRTAVLITDPRMTSSARRVWPGA